MTRTILAGLTLAVSLVAAASAEASLAPCSQPASLGVDRVFPHAAGSALRKEGELRGQEFLVSIEPRDTRCQKCDSLLRLNELDRAGREADRLHRNRSLHLVRLTTPDQLIDAGLMLIAGKLC